MAYFPTAAFWSVNPPHDRDRKTHHRTKRHGRRQQDLPTQDLWSWEDELERDGPWDQPGEYRLPREELVAAKAERRRYEEAAWKQGWKPVSTTQKFLGGGLKGSVAKSGRRPAPTPCTYRGEREYGQTPCYAVERMVSPVRVHSPVQ